MATYVVVSSGSANFCCIFVIMTFLWIGYLCGGSYLIYYNYTFIEIDGNFSDTYSTIETQYIYTGSVNNYYSKTYRDINFTNNFNYNNYNVEIDYSIYDTNFYNYTNINQQYNNLNYNLNYIYLLQSPDDNLYYNITLFLYIKRTQWSVGFWGIIIIPFLCFCFFGLLTCYCFRKVGYKCN